MVLMILSWVILKIFHGMIIMGINITVHDNIEIFSNPIEQMDAFTHGFGVL